MHLVVLGHVVGHGDNEFTDLNIITKIKREIGEVIGLRRHPCVMTLQATDQSIPGAARTMVVNEPQKVGIGLSNF